MKELTANETAKKKIPNKRKFYSAPNLPVKNVRGKTKDLIMEVLEDEQRNKKKESEGKTAGANKKPKPRKKKLSNKEVDKILMDAKVINEEEAKAEDYQFLIKKNIVKIMNVAKKGAGKDDAAAKITSINKLLQKVASESVKKNKKQQQLPLIKSEEPKKTKKKTPGDEARRAITSTQPRRKDAPTKQRPQTSTVQQSEIFPQMNRSIPSLEAKRPSTKTRQKASMQKIKSLFKALEEASAEIMPPKVGTSQAATPAVVGLYDELHAGEAKKPIAKKLVKRILPMPIGKAGPIEVCEKPLKKKKPKSDVKDKPALDTAKPRAKVLSKKKNDVLPEQLLEELIYA